VVNAHIEWIEQLNPSLNAMVLPVFVHARAEPTAQTPRRKPLQHAAIDPAFIGRGSACK
jgi:hypothetical protein